MYNQNFLRAEKSRRRKALAFTILFHLVLVGGLAFGTGLGDKITDTVKELFQEEKPIEKAKASLVKK